LFSNFIGSSNTCRDRQVANLLFHEYLVQWHLDHLVLARRVDKPLHPSLQLRLQCDRGHCGIPSFEAEFVVRLGLNIIRQIFLLCIELQKMPRLVKSYGKNYKKYLFTSEATNN
jgi:hypothetical protein